jgi:hypothetical protein
MGLPHPDSDFVRDPPFFVMPAQRSADPPPVRLSFRSAARFHEFMHDRARRQCGSGRAENMVMDSARSGFWTIVCAMRGQVTSDASGGIVNGAFSAPCAAKPPQRRRADPECTLFGGKRGLLGYISAATEHAMVFKRQVMTRARSK